MKTSISLDDKLLNALDNYRAEIRPIPKLSEAIRDLLWKSLIPKEVITEIPKGSVLFKRKSVVVERSRGRFLIRFNPQDLIQLKEKGFDVEESNKVDVSIILIPK